MPHEPANGVLRTTTHFDGNPKRTNLERARAYVYCIRSSLEPNPTSCAVLINPMIQHYLPDRFKRVWVVAGSEERERGKVSTMISRYTPVIFPFSSHMAHAV
jgi:hypothetical protein